MIAIVKFPSFDPTTSEFLISLAEHSEFLSEHGKVSADSPGMLPTEDYILTCISLTN